MGLLLVVERRNKDKTYKIITEERRKKISIFKIWSLIRFGETYNSRCINYLLTSAILHRLEKLI